MMGVFDQSLMKSLPLLVIAKAYPSIETPTCSVIPLVTNQCTVEQYCSVPYGVFNQIYNMVTQLVETQAVRLLKHVVRCYLRLSDNLR